MTLSSREERILRIWVGFSFVSSVIAGFTLSLVFAFREVPVPQFFLDVLRKFLSEPTAKALADPLLATLGTTGVLLIPLVLYLVATPYWGWRNSPLRYQEAQDCFYYIGFMLTLVGLFFSSLKLAAGLSASSTKDITTIFLQNIVALFSTIVGLFLRNTLQYFMSSDSSHPLREFQEVLAGIELTTKRISDNAKEFSATFDGASQTIRDNAPSWESQKTAVEQLMSQIRALEKVTAGFNDLQNSLGAAVRNNQSAIVSHTNAIGELTPALRENLVLLKQDAALLQKTVTEALRDIKTSSVSPPPAPPRGYGQ